MTLRKFKIHYRRGMVLIVLLTLAMIAAVSLAFDLWSFPWFAWCGLGLLAVVIVPSAVLNVVPDTTTDAPFSAGWYYALCFCWMTFTAAIADAPSFSWLIIGFGPLAILGDLIRLAIGLAPPLDGISRSDDTDGTELSRPKDH